MSLIVNSPFVLNRPSTVNPPVSYPSVLSNRFSFFAASMSWLTVIVWFDNKTPLQEQYLPSAQSSILFIKAVNLSDSTPYPYNLVFIFALNFSVSQSKESAISERHLSSSVGTPIVLFNSFKLLSANWKTSFIAGITFLLVVNKSGNSCSVSNVPASPCGPWTTNDSSHSFSVPVKPLLTANW